MPSVDTNPFVEQKETGDAQHLNETSSRQQTPAATDPAKGSPAKGARQFGDNGAKAGQSHSPDLLGQ